MWSPPHPWGPQPPRPASGEPAPTRCPQICSPRGAFISSDLRPSWERACGEAGSRDLVRGRVLGSRHVLICSFPKPSLGGITRLVKKAFFPHFMAGRCHRTTPSVCLLGAGVGQEEPLALGSPAPLRSPTVRAASLAGRSTLGGLPGEGQNSLHLPAQ